MPHVESTKKAAKTNKARQPLGCRQYDKQTHGAAVWMINAARREHQKSRQDE